MAIERWEDDLAIADNLSGNNALITAVLDLPEVQVFVVQTMSEAVREGVDADTSSVKNDARETHTYTLEYLAGDLGAEGLFELSKWAARYKVSILWLIGAESKNPEPFKVTATITPDNQDYSPVHFLLVPRGADYAEYFKSHPGLAGHVFLGANFDEMHIDQSGDYVNRGEVVYQRIPDRQDRMESFPLVVSGVTYDVWAAQIELE